MVMKLIASETSEDQLAMLRYALPRVRDRRKYPFGRTGIPALQESEARCDWKQEEQVCSGSKWTNSKVGGLRSNG